MTDPKEQDYADSGLSIQYAINDYYTRCPEKRGTGILWAGRRISTADKIEVPRMGLVRGEFLSADPTVRQGFDLNVPKGWIELPGGERVALLRTWRDQRLEDVVEYSFYSPTGVLWVWNVYEMSYPSGRKVVEKWTHNAGMWVETVGECERIYHCSHGMADPPDFCCLVFRVSITPQESRRGRKPTRPRSQ